MARFEVIHRRGAARATLVAAPEAPGWRVSPAGYPLWMIEAHLPAGATLSWPHPHGEEAIYVKAGALQLDGTRACPPGSALILEAGATPVVEATVASVVVGMGTEGGWRPSGGPAGDAAYVGDRTHLIGPRGIAEWARPPTKLTRYYTTSTCPGCRIMLMYSASEQQYGSAVHSHSGDELIHVLKGRIRVGSTWAEPGDTVAIPADVRYRFQTGDDGYGFINYRADASYYVQVDGTRLLEAGGHSQFVYTGDGTDYVSAEAYAAGPTATR
jgi:hypothetical protein